MTHVPLTNKLMIDEEVNALIAATESLGRGEEVSWTTVVKVTGFERGSKKYNAAVKKWKRHLFATKKIDVEYSANTACFRLKTGDEQVERAHRKQYVLRRNLRRTAVTAAVVDDGDLSSDELRKLRHLVVTHATEAAELIDRRIKERRPLLSMQEPLPRANGAR